MAAPQLQGAAGAPEAQQCQFWNVGKDCAPRETPQVTTLREAACSASEPLTAQVLLPSSPTPLGAGSPAASAAAMLGCSEMLETPQMPREGALPLRPGVSRCPDSFQRRGLPRSGTLQKPSGGAPPRLAV